MKVLIRKLARPSFTLYPLSDVHWPIHDAGKLDAWRAAVEADAFLKTYGTDQTDAEQPFEASYGEVKMLPPALFGIVSCSVRLNGQGRPMYELRQRIL